MTAPGNDPQDAVVREHEARRVDEYIRLRFGVEPAEDRSGLLASESPPTPAESDEEAQFAAYMRRYFPHAGRD
jgi:hypothetical protein